ncbi:DUF368 domain-containing protein [Nanoarchaeota archaeon]
MEQLITFLKGLCMGTADIIPGVSGGTIALITGIYTRLIDGIDYIADFFKPKTWEQGIAKTIKGVDFKFFIPLVLGIGIAMLALSNIIHYLLEDQAVLTYAFFFGLILASAWFVYRQLDQPKPLTFGISIIGLLFGFLIVGLSQLNATHSLPILFGSGAIAICAMILPGISGAFILLILNQYQYVLGMIKSFSITEILVFGLGAATGLLLFSKLLHYLLHKHKNHTMGFLTGLMVGSLRLPATIISDNYTGNWIGVVLLAVIGIALVYFLEKMA